MQSSLQFMRFVEADVFGDRPLLRAWDERYRARPLRELYSSGDMPMLCWKQILANYWAWRTTYVAHLSFTCRLLLLRFWPNLISSLSLLTIWRRRCWRYGGELIDTPNINALASKGMLFEQALRLPPCL